ncbi:MAG: efflux RND transporter periplasmic adaptor subunit [Gammaproteobacteria bacterium]|nr:efflux RND transporter periplasmic adaptor subunit [Gammaproteobacteria bacterium]
MNDPTNNAHPLTPRGRRFLIGGAVLGLLLLVLLYTRGFGLFASRPPPAPPPAVERHGATLVVPEASPLRAWLVTAPAEAVAVSGKIVVPGVVESDPGRTAPVLTPLAGRILELRVRPGDRVAMGQVLAVIDSPDLAQAYDDNARAASVFALTQRNLTRQSAQAKIGAVAERDLEQARSDFAQARAEYERTRARLRAVGADANATQARRLEVRAPFAGSVTTLSVATGNMVNDVTQPLMTVVHLGTVWVTALAPEKDIPLLAPGAAAQVTLDADPEHPLHGTVLTVSDVVEADSRRTKVRIAFPNADYRLKPNMFATVTLNGPSHDEVTVPTSALLMNNDRISVFVATAPWRFQRRTVELDLQEGERAAVRHGLEAGEQVVVRGGILLND